MAVGLNLDTEYLERAGIPSGGAGTLSAGGFADFFAGVWLYRPSSTATYALTASGWIIHGQAGAREIGLGFNSAGSNLSDLNLQAIYNSGGGTGTPYSFPLHTGADFLDEWVYYFFYEDSADNLVAGYILLSDLATAVTNSYANDNAGSQYINDLTFGNDSGHGAVVLGHYAYARARDSAASAANVLTYAASDATISGDWGFWPLDTNTDTADDSGNSRTLTFGGTLSTETSPTLAAGPVTHPSTGALAAQAATVAGTSVHLTLHATSGALAAQAATIAGTAADHHSNIGALAAQAATVAGTAAHRTLHTTSGALTGQAATVAGTAAHQNATSGALVAQAATIAGSADHTTAGASHSTSGALAGQDATVAGSATHLTLHATSGALAAQAATVAGSAVHPHTTSGALAAQAAAISGTAADQFATTGALVAQAATVSGTAVHTSAGSHPTSGDLAAGAATVSGSAEVVHIAVDATPGWGTYPFRRNKKTRQQPVEPVDMAAVQAKQEARRALRAAEARDQAITAQLREIYAEQDALAMGIAAVQQDLAQQQQDDDDLSMILALAC